MTDIAARGHEAVAAAAVAVKFIDATHTAACGVMDINDINGNAAAIFYILKTLVYAIFDLT